jgi:hypothetical protein
MLREFEIIILFQEIYSILHPLKYQHGYTGMAFVFAG